jgi:serine/threonine protein kinase/Tol biopolymer transport system component
MSPQQSIGHYRITAKLGEGGMGAVYRATDTKLNRDVAIKVLPEAFSQDSARMQRFEREAQVLASLNHPNIAAIYGVEQGAIVMELVEGADLAGPLPVDTVIDFARQIAAGLEAAHEKGIVHRDLKPANIKVTAEGQIKLLDFGLAKAREESSSTSTASPTMSPTLSLAMTQAGMILGTAAYMSPEQARGKPVDRRADIWAYGVILYELLTGRHLYGGETVTDTLAAVVLKDPDFSALPESTPPRLRRIIERCLRKDPKLRMRDIGEARIALDEPELPAPVSQADAATRPSPPRAWIAASAIFGVALIALAAVHFRETPPPREMVRFAVPAPDGAFFGNFNNLALSPDGRKLVFSVGAGGRVMLWMRSLDSFEARPLPGTETANFPFWSPDSRFVGFSADGKLKKMDLSGGPPQTLCAVGGNAPTIGAWTPDGFIYFANGREGIFRVPQAGGEPVRITTTNMPAGESFHAYPTTLPDGRNMLMLVTATAQAKSLIYLMSLDGKQKKPLFQTQRSFSYVPPRDNETVGHILLIQQDTLMAQPVDPKTFAAAGDAFPIADHVGNQLSQAFFTASVTGALAYRGGGNMGATQLTWMDRTGKVLSNLGSTADYGPVALSRDGTRAAVGLQDSQNLDIWMFDLARGIPSRFTFNPQEDTDPAWSPDGTKLAFSSRRDGSLYALYAKDSSGTALEQQLHKADAQERVTDWSPDGKFLIYARVGQRGTALWTLSDPLDPAQRKAAAYLDDEHSTTEGQFSPGPAGLPRWVAYTSNESGRSEIFVQSFPAGAGKFQISKGGGTQARWRRDGKEMFYIAPDGKLMAVDVKTSPRFEAGIPHALFDSRILVPNSVAVVRYDVAPDGQRFLVNTSAQAAGGTASEPIHVVLNWLAGVKK